MGKVGSDCYHMDLKIAIAPLVAGIEQVALTRDDKDSRLDSYLCQSWLDICNNLAICGLGAGKSGM